MSNFFNKIRIATEKDTKARWCAGQPGEKFRCGFCGHKIKENEKFLILYTNDIRHGWGNPLICETCLDTWKENLEDMREEWKQRHAEWNRMTNSDMWWWFTSHYINNER